MTGSERGPTGALFGGPTSWEGVLVLARLRSKGRHHAAPGVPARLVGLLIGRGGRVGVPQDAVGVIGIAVGQVAHQQHRLHSTGISAIVSLGSWSWYLVLSGAIG